MSDLECKLAYSWAIKNVTLWEKETNYSPLFTLTDAEDSTEKEWCFRLTFGKNFANVFNLHLFLVAVSKPSVSFSRPSITVQDSLNKSDNFLPPAKVTAEEEVSVGVIKYSGENYHGVCDESFLTDTLKITCVSEAQKSEEAKIVAEDSDLVKLSDDISSLFKSGWLSDVHIEAGGEVFKVHKIILHARCPALLKDLKDKSDASAIDSIISDVEPSALKVLLSYLYSGKLNIDNTSLLAGLHFALESYELDSLKKLVCFTPIKVLAETFIPTRRACLVWPIKNFSSLKLQQKVCSPIAVVGDETFQLVVMLSEDSKDVKIYLRRISEVIEKEISCTCTITVDADEGENKSNFQRHRYQEERNWCLPTVIKKKWLYENKNRNLPNDTLTLRCDVAYSMGEATSNLVKTVSTAKSYPQNYCDLRKLSEDLQSICNKMISRQDVFSDMELYLKEEKLCAHKAILYSRWPELAEIAASGDKAVHEVDLKDEDPSVVLPMLNYVYTGKVSDCNYEQVTAMYMLTNKMKLFALRDLCLARLTSCPDFKDAPEILKLADAHSNETAKACTQKYILDNPIEILKTNEWMTLLKEKPKLINEMFVQMADKFKVVILADDDPRVKTD